MNIIFGDTVKQIADTHTVLELDTFKLMPSERLITSYCVIDNLPLAEFPILETNKHIHQQLIEQYSKKNWEFCRSAVNVLTGSWNGELDSFYDHLLSRITDYEENPPLEDWTPFLSRFEFVE